MVRIPQTAAEFLELGIEGREVVASKVADRRYRLYASAEVLRAVAEHEEFMRRYPPHPGWRANREVLDMEVSLFESKRRTRMGAERRSLPDRKSVV